MQADRIAAAARTAGSVRGLGVCDALRIELESVQRAGLELQLEARMAALERRDGIEPPRAASERHVGPSFEAGERAGGLGAERELGELGEELRLLTRIRASVPGCAHESFALTGPAGLVLELVGACLAAEVANVHARLGEGGPGALSSAASKATWRPRRLGLRRRWTAGRSRPTASSLAPTRCTCGERRYGRGGAAAGRAARVAGADR
jgi:hypothetical protein